MTKNNDKKLKKKIEKKIYIFDSPDKENQEKFDPKNPHVWVKPFRACIMAPPTTGKSCLVNNIILHAFAVDKKFDMICVLKYLGDSSKEYNKLDCDDVIVVKRNTIPDNWQYLFCNEGEETDDNPTIELLKDSKIKKLLILEDIATKHGALTKTQKELIDRIFGVVSSHLNCSVVLCAQDAVEISPIIRRKCNYLTVFRSPISYQLNHLGSTMGLTKQEMIYLMRYVLKNKHDCLTFMRDQPFGENLYKNLLEKITLNDDDNNDDVVVDDYDDDDCSS